MQWFLPLLLWLLSTPTPNQPLLAVNTFSPATAAANGGHSSNAPAATQHINVLMIGNSYTAGTWRHFSDFAAADPNTSLTLQLATRGGWTALDHYQNRKSAVYQSGSYSLLDLLALETWDYVVIQEQSTRPSQAYLGHTIERNQFERGMLNLDTVIKREAPSAEVIYFQTWPRNYGNSYLTTYFSNEPKLMHKATATAYAQAALATGADTVHVGSAWNYSMYQNASLSLHSGDGSHAGAAGGYLAGAMFFAYLYDLTPVGNSYSGGLSPADVSWLQSLAEGAWQLLD